MGISDTVASSREILRMLLPANTRLEVEIDPASLPVRVQSAVLEQVLVNLVFNAFYTTKPQGKGTGLGLASVRALMEIQGGTVEVESLPQQGTTFRLAFPAPA